MNIELKHQVGDIIYFIFDSNCIIEGYVIEIIIKPEFVYRVAEFKDGTGRGGFNLKEEEVFNLDDLYEHLKKQEEKSN